MSHIAITEANRFSNFVIVPNSPDYRVLVAWQVWFKQRGIVSAIAETERGYALYREGLIDSDIDTVTIVDLDGNLREMELDYSKL